MGFQFVFAKALSYCLQLEAHVVYFDLSYLFLSFLICFMLILLVPQMLCPAQPGWACNSLGKHTVLQRCLKLLGESVFHVSKFQRGEGDSKVNRFITKHKEYINIYQFDSEKSMIKYLLWTRVNSGFSLVRGLLSKTRGRPFSLNSPLCFLSDPQRARNTLSLHSRKTYWGISSLQPNAKLPAV